jgi:putative transposase
VIDRDLNAAINILKEALRSTPSSVGMYAYGQGSSGLVSGSGETVLEEVGTNLH